MRRKTELNKFLHKICIERDITMKQMAKQLGYSYVYIWMIMTNKRSVTDSFIDNVVKTYDLTKNDELTLAQYSLDTRKSLRLNMTRLTDEKKSLAILLTKKLPVLTEQQTETIRKVLNAS